MYKRKILSEKNICLDNGDGKKEIFRVQDFDLVPLDEEVYGKFFGGDSYVIKYTFENNGRPGYVIYFWQVPNHLDTVETYGRRRLLAIGYWLF